MLPLPFSSLQLPVSKARMYHLHPGLHPLLCLLSNIAITNCLVRFGSVVDYPDIAGQKLSLRFFRTKKRR